ncbi:uncharacterized protein MONBRDRAFT_25194 [Monosiga brevicollis MX1]|uniref:New component of the BRCA1-A complex n=1 Tax=Monosiga brevicollis TaxID=81824 RepID=A9UYP1_MONBE|nr:uncharacterized protein MONBRDRAFT_25194 [Monosiga brevicollis MX1]EDQ89637.1 predicted protein [Monosiga brevicollis MX1]|eukprot:XP_001745666.1 hypothetical protein [Monosiga brevicollis MX1]
MSAAVPAERIVFLLDTSQASAGYFGQGQVQTGTKLTMAMQSIRHFAKLKTALDQRHQFALGYCAEGLVLRIAFAKLGPFLSSLRELEEDQQHHSSEHQGLDISAIAAELSASLNLPLALTQGEEDMAPILRVILLHTRPTPPMASIQPWSSLAQNLALFVDVVDLHSPELEPHDAAEVTSTSATLAVFAEYQQPGYLLEAGLASEQLHQAMMILLGHPLQRPAQPEWPAPIMQVGV